MFNSIHCGTFFLSHYIIAFVFLIVFNLNVSLLPLLELVCGVGIVHGGGVRRGWGGGVLGLRLFPGGRRGGGGESSWGSGGGQVTPVVGGTS